MGYSSPRFPFGSTTVGLLLLLAWALATGDGMRSETSLSGQRSMVGVSWDTVTDVHRWMGASEEKDGLLVDPNGKPLPPPPPQPPGGG